SSDRANGRVSETLGKAAQGSASLGRIRLPNIQASSNAACRCHGAKIHVKSRDRSMRLYRLRATAKADELENFYELVKNLFTIDSALAFTSPPRPGARSFAKGITTRRRERRQTDGKGDAEGKRTAKKERETVRDGEGEKGEKQEKKEEEEERRGVRDRDTTTARAKTAGGGRGFLAAARRTRVLATVARFDDEDKEDVDERAGRRLALSRYEKKEAEDRPREFDIIRRRKSANPTGKSAARRASRLTLGSQRSRPR
ncbi:hypothetical protein ALC56_01301, partial [Trachymyrmex septentrionalis]